MVDVRIVYVAEAAPGVANADVQDIVHRSRRNNAIAGITVSVRPSPSGEV